MKYLLLLVLIIVLTGKAFSQCSVGGNGLAVSSVITIDGNMSDWNLILSDPDNNTYDAVPDMDAPIADVGRDFTRFAFTESVSNLYLYFSRAGSATNSVDALAYIDVNNNGLMETNEPVVAISWSGSNGNGRVDMYNYVASATGGDAITGDGVDMPGTLLLRNTLGVIGKGSANGLALEVAIPFVQLYKQGSSNPADILAANEQFKFHISTINGSPTSVPGPNAINDNFQGCYSGIMLLPLKLEYFESIEKQNEVELTWKVADNEEAVRFEIEGSVDGKNFHSIVTIHPTKNTGTEKYHYSLDDNAKGNRYYRLKIIDTDGTVTYSKVVGVGSGSAVPVIKISNPVYSDLTITCESKEEQTCSIRVFTISGHQVFSQRVAIKTGSNRIQVAGMYMKAAGGYIVQFTDHSNKQVTQKIVKL